jgi:hypothetical protein
MPIGRFLDHLHETGKYDEYMERLIRAYNPAAAAGVMCRTTLSVDWEGRLYDCDFNQMLGVTVRRELPQSIREFAPEAFARRLITTGQHCYGCTAGAGSGCRGAIAEETAASVATGFGRDHGAADEAKSHPLLPRPGAASQPNADHLHRHPHPE